MVLFKRVVLGLAVLGLSGCSTLQSWLNPPPAPPCQEPVYRQFDFWIGQWDVVQEVGETASAFNEISAIVQGCALKEQYHTQSGFSGESLNWYDPQLGQWRQTWVDNAGTVLQLVGGLNVAGEMVLSGNQRRDEHGEPILDRITWTPQSDGSVVQLWQTSLDEGATWSQLFRGTYLPRTPARAEPPRQRY